MDLLSLFPAWLLEHGVAFVIVLPLLMGAITAILPSRTLAWWTAFIVTLIVVVTSFGLVLMVVTGDAFNVFVFLEVSSISTYALVAMGAARDRRALTASYNYLILGSIGATFFVIGLGFLYMETGTLNMADMARILADLDGGSRVACLRA